MPSFAERRHRLSGHEAPFPAPRGDLNPPGYEVYRAMSTRVPFAEGNKLADEPYEEGGNHAIRASSPSMEIVLVRYRDHVLFRNMNPDGLSPQLRETVGWLARQDEQAVLLLWDRSVTPLPHERSEVEKSGLVLLRSDIVEIRRLRE